ncbi:MAG TPA: Glu/Leu/Phe/Val dehydrogenase dimerization domain-containing protein [Thermoanaerobaculia bacterium]|nr:Glu/Leu/Phe/Val dehydrogenase dimerization domain-containing protein [Thermoanaerobaculia bacterium]
MSTLAAQIAAWDGLATLARFDHETGTWIFIALHDDTLGVPTGGTRMKVYPSPEAGLADAHRLAAGMTAKWAAIDFPVGGGKAVLAVPRPLEGEERRGLLRRYGRLVQALRGGFSTGQDLGISLADMDVVGEESSHVHGIGPSVRDVPSGVYTARGVYAAVRASLAQVFGSAELAGRRVLVEGVGAVGVPLARSLVREGAKVLLSDLDADRAARLAAELGAGVVAPEAVPTTAADVYAPCAVGAVLNARTIPRLACRVVAGAANNQLAEEEDAQRLHDRGILYAPDFIANAGGAVGLFSVEAGASAEEVDRRLLAIGDTLGEIFREATERRESPLAGAQRRVAAVLARRRAERDAGRA